LLPPPLDPHAAVVVRAARHATMHSILLIGHSWVRGTGLSGG
jgi:hypothetical protein